MSYIGKIPATGNFVKLDAITCSSTNTYNLLQDSVAFTPESANHMLVSLNGVIQAPITAFTVSGSTITFIPASGTLSSSDSIDFIMVYGNVLDIGTPSDNTVSASKLTTDSVIEAKIQNDAVTRDKINAISTSSLPSFEAKGDGSSQDGYIQLNCSQNSHGIKLKSPPHSANASYVLTFPNNDGNANEFLKTDGSGVMSWAEAGGGKVLQVVQTHITSVFQTTSSSLVDVTNLTANITPSATSSKVLVILNTVAGNDSSSTNRIALLRGSTDIGFGSGGSGTGFYEHNISPQGNGLTSVPYTFLDTPNTTSATTYKIQCRGDSGTLVIGGRADGNNPCASTLTLMEIGA